MLHAGDPVRHRMSQERMKHPPVTLTAAMNRTVIEAIADCEARSGWSILAASIEKTHSHMLLTYTERNIDHTVKWIKDQATKRIHRTTPHAGPVWCKGRWRTFLFDIDSCQQALDYIEQHNVRRGVGPRPYPFITTDFMP